MAGRNERSHFYRADLLDDAVGRGDVGSAIQHGGVKPMRDRGQRGQFPVAEMAGENQRGFAVELQFGKQLVGARLDLDAAVLRTRGIVLPSSIEMLEFGPDAPTIVPPSRENER